MVVLEASSIGGAIFGGPYAQGAPALKIVPKRYLGVHQWLSPIATKDLKEQIVSLHHYLFQSLALYEPRRQKNLGALHTCVISLLQQICCRFFGIVQSLRI